jgi:hypothetical protein
LSIDQIERYTANLRNLIVAWDPRGIAETHPRAYDDLVVQLWALLVEGASRAEISEFLWKQVQRRDVCVPEVIQIDQIADEISERVAGWSHGAAVDLRPVATSIKVARGVADSDPYPKVAWAVELPASKPAKIRDASDADFPYWHEGFHEYEASADPDRSREEEAQRRFRGQYLRRIRRLRERDRHSD